MATPHVAFRKRFWAKVRFGDNCWTWTASIDAYGYGQIGRNGSMVKAHRAAYELTFGVIPPGLVIDHLCHTRACVKPTHLRLATAKQNSENRAGAQRNSKTGVRGVSWNPQMNKWIAIVNSAGRRYYCGHHERIEDAARAARLKRDEVFTHNKELGS